MKPITLFVTLALLIASAGIAEAQGQQDRKDAASVHVSTNHEILEGFLGEIMTEFGGEPGRWTFNLYDVDMMLISDEDADRMRVVAQVAEAPRSMPAEHLRILMEANFDRALDAKYAIWRDVLWATFAHPLGDLTRNELQNGIRQVATLARTYGTTFTSTDVSFGAPRSP